MKLGFGRHIRPLWTLEDVDFLNHGSFGATPIPVRLEQQRWRDRFDAQPVRFVMRELPVQMRDVADRLGAFLGAEGRDLVWMDNATTGIATVLAAQNPQPGDEWLTTDHVYGAVRKAMHHLGAGCGVRVVEAAVPFPNPTAEAVVSAVEAAFSDRTRLLVIDHITSFSGLIFPVERLIALAQSRGVPVLVDGAHAPGMLPLNVAALGADYYVGNCHKWLFAPKGCAFLWAHRERQAALRPLAISHGVDDGFTGAFDWTGTRDPSPWLALPEAIRFAESMPLDAMRAYNADLLGEAVARITEVGVFPAAPATMRPFMATFPVPPHLDGATLHDRWWDDHRIEVPVFPWGGRWWFRISAQVYNEPAQYERLASVLRA
jgi:isopenicillin-N epimerase